MNLWGIAVVTLFGVIYGYFEPGKLTYAFGALTLYVLLPALLFEGAWNLDYRVMRRMRAVIFTLAVPGVALTSILIAGALSVVRVPFGPALLAGAILSATDPVSVIAVFRRLHVPSLLRTVVESEALFNDAISVVLYRAVLLVVLAQAPSAASIGRVALVSLLGSAGGILIGCVLAFIATIMLRNRRNAHLQIAATIVCAYASYFVAERLSMSGIFATISCGIALRYFERRWVSVAMVTDVEGFWDVCAIGANGVIFFLIGASLSVAVLAHNVVFVVAALIGVGLARGAISALILPAGFPSTWLDVIRAAGVRGALSLALAISLPSNVPYRDAIIAATFAVAIATILSSTFTVPRVVERVRR